MARAATSIPSTSIVSRPASIAWVLGQTLLIFGFTTLPTPLYGDYACNFGFSNLVLTLIYATYVAGTLSVLFLLGRLSDQIGRRPVALVAIAGSGLAGTLFLLANSAAWLFAARLVTGLAAGLSSGTVVAWLKELHSKNEAKTASRRTVAINVLGLGVGPLLCGLLARFTSIPLAAPYLVYLLLLALLAAGIARTEDTIQDRRPLARVELGIRVGVPEGIRAAFMAPAIANLVLYSMVGFYSALTPGLIAKTLHITSHAISGALISELFVLAAVTVYATAALSSRIAMLTGFVLMLPALGLMVLAEEAASLPALIAGTAFGGMALGTGYRGAIEVGNQIAPSDKRAELISMLFVCGNLGLSVPVIGVGLLAAATSPALADATFAGVTALFSLAGLGFGILAGEQKSTED
jgi:hypothetical protein